MGFKGNMTLPGNIDELSGEQRVKTDNPQCYLACWQDC